MTNNAITTLTFLGTGNYLAQGRYWNSFVIDGNVLVEPAPTVLPHIRQCGFDVAALDAIFVSHFHADHTFGWPFLLLEAARRGRDRPLYVIGPPSVDAFVHDMTRVGAVLNVHDFAHAALDIRYVEVDGTAGWQGAGPVKFRAVEVEHVPHLRCFGYLIGTVAERVVGYSGDTRPCSGLDELARASDVLVLECNGAHPDIAHMDTGSVRALRERFPDTPFVLTHVGDDVVADEIDNAVLPSDFDTVRVTPSGLERSARAARR